MRWLETRQNFNRRTSFVSLNTNKKPSWCTHCRDYKNLLALIIYQVQRFEFSSCFLRTGLHIVNEGEDEWAVLDIQVRGGTQLVSLQIPALLLKLAGAMIPCGLCCFCCSPNIWTWPLLGSGTLSESGTWRGEAAASRGRKIELPNSIENTWIYSKLNKINFPNIFKNSKYPVLLVLRRSHIGDAKSV